MTAAAAPNAIGADVRRFFEAFGDAFGTFDGARVAELCCVPHVGSAAR